MRAAGIITIFFLLLETLAARTYYLDSKAGDDSFSGLSRDRPLKSFSALASRHIEAGDSILLRGDRLFVGSLKIKNIKGTSGRPILIGRYGNGKRPVIDARGFLAGVEIWHSSHVIVEKLEIRSDGAAALEPKAKVKRYGVMIAGGSEHITVRDLHIHRVFATEQTPSKGRDGTTASGHGIFAVASSFLKIEDCRIERVGRYGIRIQQSEDVEIARNHTIKTGGSGIQINRSRRVYVHHNNVEYSGSFVDKRMHGRGSGSWTWKSSDVLYEYNRFAHSRGKMDSCGVHIDYGCRNVIIQYNLSIDNSGGFIEVLGDNYNNAYRYNISVNDGNRRRKHHRGNLLFFSGYVGGKRPQKGPYNTYIYNNTVYAGDGVEPAFKIKASTRGFLIANNIFYVEGKIHSRIRDRRWGPNYPFVFRNNLYLRRSQVPSGDFVTDRHPIIADPGFRRPGGTRPEDYIPLNKDLSGMGITVDRIPGDTLGVKGGLKVSKDILGRPVPERPSLGAIVGPVKSTASSTLF